MEEGKKFSVTSFPDVKKVPLSSDIDFIIIACDGIWDCFTNEEAIAFSRKVRTRGPKQSSPMKQKSLKGGANSPLKLDKKALSVSGQNSATKPKGETSFIIEEMMDQGIAKGDITLSDGTGTDNMTCIIVQFRQDGGMSDGTKSTASKEESKK